MKTALRLLCITFLLSMSGCVTIGGSLCYTTEKGTQICAVSDGKSVRLDASFRGQK